MVVAPVRVCRAAPEPNPALGRSCFWPLPPPYTPACSRSSRSMKTTLLPDLRNGIFRRATSRYIASGVRPSSSTASVTLSRRSVIPDSPWIDMGIHILLNCRTNSFTQQSVRFRGRHMDVETFRRTVFQAGLGMPAESLTLALRHYCDHIRRFTPESVRLCVQLAGLLAEAATTPTAAEPADLPQTPTAVVLSEHLHGKLQPWVKRLRKTLAGSTEPPCASLEEAIEWCKRVEPAWLLSHRPDEPLQFVQQHPRYQPTPPQDAEEVPSDLLERARQLLPPLTPRHVLADILECVREHTEGVGRSAWYTYLQDQPDYALTLPMLERETRSTASTSPVTPVAWRAASTWRWNCTPLMRILTNCGHCINRCDTLWTWKV